MEEEEEEEEDETENWIWWSLCSAWNRLPKRSCQTTMRCETSRFSSRFSPYRMPPAGRRQTKIQTSARPKDTQYHLKSSSSELCLIWGALSTGIRTSALTYAGQCGLGNTLITAVAWYRGIGIAGDSTIANYRYKAIILSILNHIFHSWIHIYIECPQKKRKVFNL